MYKYNLISSRKSCALFFHTILCKRELLSRRVISENILKKIFLSLVLTNTLLFSTHRHLTTKCPKSAPLYGTFGDSAKCSCPAINKGLHNLLPDCGGAFVNNVRPTHAWCRPRKSTKSLRPTSAISGKSQDGGLSDRLSSSSECVSHGRFLWVISVVASFCWINEFSPNQLSIGVRIYRVITSTNRCEVVKLRIRQSRLWTADRCWLLLQ